MGNLDALRHYLHAWIVRSYVSGRWQAIPNLAFEDQSLNETRLGTVTAQCLMNDGNTGGKTICGPAEAYTHSHGARLPALAPCW